MQEQFRKEIQALQNDYLMNRQQSISLLKERQIMIQRFNSLSKYAQNIKDVNLAFHQKVESLQEKLDQKEREVECLMIQNKQKDILYQRIQRELKESWQENKRLKAQIDKEFQTVYLQHGQQSKYSEKPQQIIPKKDASFHRRAKKNLMKANEKSKIDRTFEELKFQYESKSMTKKKAKKKLCETMREAGKIIKIDKSIVHH